jgi:protein TonB
MGTQKEPGGARDQQVGVIDRADLLMKAPPPPAALAGLRENPDQDYLKRGKSGRRNFGFFVVLAVHWLVIWGLVSGITPPWDKEPEKGPIEIVDTLPDTEPESKPEITPPEPKIDPVVVWVPAPVIPNVAPESDSTAPQGSTTPTPAGPDTPVRVDPRFPLSKPDYPPSDKRLGHEGVVVLLLLVGSDGRVIEAKVERSSGYPSLDDAALRQAKTWRFKPAEEKGKPVAAWYRTSVRFQLDGR